MIHIPPDQPKEYSAIVGFDIPAECHVIFHRDPDGEFVVDSIQAMWLGDHIAQPGQMHDVLKAILFSPGRSAEVGGQLQEAFKSKEENA